VPEDFVQVAPDSTGAKVRTRSRTIGANTVEEQYVIEQPERVATGVYIAAPATQTILAAAHATTTGFFHLLNTSAAKMIELRRVEFIPFRTAVTAFPTAPEIVLQRCTFTGTATGTVVTPAKSVRTTQNGETADVANTGELRAPGGAVITGTEIFHRFVMPATIIIYAAGTQSTDIVVPQMYRPTDEDGRVVLATGEGVLIRQDTAGTASDTRKFAINLSWREYTIP
jgi:hypothetical protein